MTNQHPTNSPDPQSQNTPNPILTLMELARRARRAESAAALQFMLVNQTMPLVRYTMALLWVEDEGVLLQSGVSHVDRNSPFMQWANDAATMLADQPAMCVVTGEMLSPSLVRGWGEWLPANVLWLPLAAPEPERHAGLLLCRDLPFTEGELALLNEWVEIWSHAWVKLAAPSVRGELTKLWHRLHDHFPSRERVLLEAHRVLAGGQTTVQTVRANPYIVLDWLKTERDTVKQKLLAWRDWFKTQGVEGMRLALVTEVKAIWADKRRRWKWIIWTLVLFPVRLSVLVPGELVPANPGIIRVPIEGVVDEFFVIPNEKVTVGQPLFKLDLTSLLSKAQVAQQEIQVAAQEYRQSALQSLTDAKSRGQLAAQEGKAAERRIEAEYSQAMLDKATIESPRDGVVIFDDPTEWIGKPVVAGEKIMVVATEGQVEIEAWIPVSDMMDVPKDASVTLYLNAKPFSPVSGQMRYVGHEPMARPDGSYAYRLRASLPEGEKGPRVGLKGTAKINGQFVPFSYWVLRKPLAMARQYLGI